MWTCLPIPPLPLLGDGGTLPGRVDHGTVVILIILRRETGESYDFVEVLDVIQTTYKYNCIILCFYIIII